MERDQSRFNPHSDAQASRTRFLPSLPPTGVVQGRGLASLQRAVLAGRDPGTILAVMES